MAPSDKQDYEVNWKSHMNHMKDAFESLLHNSELVDVTLYCEGHRIGAHKMVLSACSPYFRNIFKDVPCQHHVIVLNNVDFAIMENIMQFMYHGQANVHNSRLSLFLQTARSLKISGLMDTTETMATAAAEGTDSVVEPPISSPPQSGAVVTKRKRSGGGEARQQVGAAKLTRPNSTEPTAPVEDNNVGLLDVVKCEPIDVAFDPLTEDPLQHDTSMNVYLQETQDLIRQEDLEYEESSKVRSSSQGKFAPFFEVRSKESCAVCKLCSLNNVRKIIKMTQHNTTGLKRHLQYIHIQQYSELFGPPGERQTKTDSR